MAGGWESLGLLPELVQTVEEDFDWILPSAIQDECIPLLLGGGDVMASAETGSGKTAAFVLPLLQLCVEHKERSKTSPLGKKGKAPDDKGKKQFATATKFVMSMLDRDPTIAHHPDGKSLRIQSQDKTRWAGCRCSAGVLVDAFEKGDDHVGYSFECSILDKDGMVRVGWSSADASLELGKDKEGYGYGGTGTKVNGGNYDPFPQKGNKISFTMGDVIGCHLKICPPSEAVEEDKNKKKDICAILSFSKNGEHVGDAFEVARIKKKQSFYPVVCMKNAQCELNFGDNALRYPPPEGYQALAKAVASSNDTSDIIIINPRDSLSGQSEQQQNDDQKGPLAIVIEPTRDLAEQSYRAFVDLGKRLQDPPVQAALLVGGVKPKVTLKLIEQNSVDVLVGTPPIIASYMKKGTIQASRCRFFVLDEADELVSTDSVNHVRAVYGRLLASAGVNQDRFDRLQVCFFSATLHSKKVRDLAESLCYQPLWVDLRGSNDSILPDTVHHCVVEVSPSASPKLLEANELIESDAVHRNGILDAGIEVDKLGSKERDSEIVKQLKARVLLDVMEEFNMEQVLIFCRTNLDCELVEKFLRRAGNAVGMGISDKYSCRVLASMRTMEERQQNLQDFKSGEVRCLICTDVAARGIDIQQLPFVINYTLPDKPEIYVHRIGRVGRAQRMGLAVSLVSSVKERVWFCQKGEKPPCPDTRDFDKGGNCIWYDEPKYLGAIEKLLQRNSVSITKLKWPELKLPKDIQSIINSEGYGENAQSGGALDPAVKTKMESIESRVKQLEIIEDNLQSSYWKMRKKHIFVKSI